MIRVVVQMFVIQIAKMYITPRLVPARLIHQAMTVIVLPIAATAPLALATTIAPAILPIRVVPIRSAVSMIMTIVIQPVASTTHGSVTVIASATYTDVATL